MENRQKSYHLSPADVEWALINLNHLVFDVTDACNLRCKYCVYGDLYSGFGDHLSHFLPVEDAKAVIDYLVELWENHPSFAPESCFYVNFFGGEPLMNFHFIHQVVSYINSLNHSRVFSFGMTSNCLLLDRYMDFLVENDFQLLCSLDGDREADSYRVRLDGSPSFDKVYKNLKLLREKYPSYFESESVRFNAVLHDRNNVQDLISFFEKEFNKTPTIGELNDSGIREDQKSRFNAIFRSKSEDICRSENPEKLKKSLDFEDPDSRALMFYLKSTTGNSFRSYNDLLIEDDGEPSFLTGTCLPFTRLMNIKADGTILQCSKIHDRFILGKVKNGEVQLDFEEICNFYNRCIDKLIPQCRVCANKKTCGSCFYYIDGIDTANVRCPDFLTKNQLKQQENRLLRYLYEHPELYRKFLCETVLI